ncbi:MAG: SdpI family protein [Woeseiaceae bacterium]|nr:SdpI family protein [Woeseiaceae bacterium]
MSTSRANIICLLMITAVIVLTVILYPGLPEQIPTHWNFEGQVDGYMPKPWGVIVLPLAALFSFAVMRLVPVISPKGFRTDKFIDVINIFTVAIVGFMSGVALLVLLEAAGLNVRINQMIYAGLGLLFIVLGMYMGKVGKNFFIGIRTPWTLASDEVWNRTHRVAGKVLVAVGLVFLLSAFVRISPAIVIAAVVVLILVPVVYSFVIYRRLEGFGPDDKNSDGDVDR